jgi:hypothetical protein
MEEIANNIFIEKGYPGVITAVLRLSQGLLMVDAPYRVDDQVSWRQKLQSMGGGSGRLMVMLDTHTDRLLGIQSIDFPVLAHQKTLDIIQTLPMTQRATEVKPGLVSESQESLQNLRWTVPDMMYTHQVSIYWDQAPVVITHQPGGHFAGSWVRYDPEKVIFIGDSVVIHQPPFLGWADLDRWIDELHWLCSDTLLGYKIINGRNGLVRRTSIIKLINFLTTVKGLVNELLEMDNREAGIAQIAPKLLREFSFEYHMTEFYKSRLMWGLKQLIKRIESKNTDA